MRGFSGIVHRKRVIVLKMIAAIDVPLWIQIFVITGIILILFVVPIRILWEMTKGGRDRRKRIEDFAGRLRERFDEVETKRSVFGTDVIRFKHEGRSVSISLPEKDEVVVRLEVPSPPKFPCVIRTKSGIAWPFALEGIRLLPRIRIYDALLDDAVLIHSTRPFGDYLRELALAAVPPKGKPAGIAENIIVLRRAPGLRWFRLMMSEGGGFRVRFRLRAEDLLYRPDELESVVHHATALYDSLVIDS